MTQSKEDLLKQLEGLSAVELQELLARKQLAGERERTIADYARDPKHHYARRLLHLLDEVLQVVPGAPGERIRNIALATKAGDLPESLCMHLPCDGTHLEAEYEDVAYVLAIALSREVERAKQAPTAAPPQTVHWDTLKLVRIRDLTGHDPIAGLDAPRFRKVLRLGRAAAEKFAAQDVYGGFTLEQIEPLFVSLVRPEHTGNVATVYLDRPLPNPDTVGPLAADALMGVFINGKFDTHTAQGKFAKKLVADLIGDQLANALREMLRDHSEKNGKD